MANEIFIGIVKKTDEVAKKKFFLSEQANFSASDRLGRNLPTVQIKLNLNLI